MVGSKWKLNFRGKTKMRSFTEIKGFSLEWVFSVLEAYVSRAAFPRGEAFPQGGSEDEQLHSGAGRVSSSTGILHVASELRQRKSRTWLPKTQAPVPAWISFSVSRCLNQVGSKGLYTADIWPLSPPDCKWRWCSMWDSQCLWKWTVSIQLFYRWDKWGPEKLRLRHDVGFPQNSAYHRGDACI